MKKTIISVSIVLATFSLMAFSCINWSNGNTIHKEQSQSVAFNTSYNFTYLDGERIESKFIYDIDSRFVKTISKSDLHNVKSIRDIFTENEIEGIESFRDVKLVVLPVNEHKFAKGENNNLNQDQLDLLQSADYSTDILIEAFCEKDMLGSGRTEDYCFVYYMTVVPEIEAEYKDGDQSLIDFLKKNSWKEVAGVTKDKLRPGKISFTVTKEGKIDFVALESTSGYESVDDKMIKLIKDLPGEWEPAANADGIKVDQVLVYSFGLIGC